MLRMVNLVRRLCTSQHCYLNTARTAEATPTRFIHCECALLAFIHNQTAVPYIGVSKLSCAFCDIYFAVYRDVTNTNICTRGAHNQTSPWLSPVLDNDPVVEGQIREALCSKMLEKIGNSWKDYCRASRGSQSTIASSQESEVVGHDGVPLRCFW